MMLFWSTAAILTLLASLAVLLPIVRRPAGAAANSPTLAVYRDQLAEIDRDAARGLIRAEEAEQARAEIARRLLKLDAATALPDGPAARRPAMTRALAAAAVLAVPLTAWGIYGVIGSPDLPGQPLSARLTQDPDNSSIDELVARAEQHLSLNPEDGRGWDVLAPIYLRMARGADAMTAYRNAIRLLGATSGREAGLGEATAVAAGGIVTSEARQAFERALALEPAEPRARYFLAMALAQDGSIAEAATAWEELAATLPEDSPWRDAAQRAGAEARQRLTADAGAPEDAGADADDGVDAGMIEQMVAGLDERLRQTPDDPEGWKRLVRSYVVLGRPDQARDALQRGAAALGAGTRAAADLMDFAATLDLGKQEQTP